MINQSNKMTFEDAFEALLEHKQRKLEKNKEHAERIQMAKTWIGLGMDENQVSIILGVSAASLANVFGTMSFSSFKNNNDYKFKPTINEVERYAKSLTKNINDLFNKRGENIVLDTSSKFLSDVDLRVVKNRLDEANDDNDEEMVEKLEDLTAQTAALAVVDYVNELEHIAKQNKNLDAGDVELEGYRSLVEISKFDNGSKIIQSALNSSVVKNEFKNSKIGAFASIYANLESTLKPDIAKQYVSEQEKAKKKDKKKKANTPL